MVAPIGFAPNFSKLLVRRWLLADTSEVRLGPTANYSAINELWWHIYKRMPSNYVIHMWNLLNEGSSFPNEEELIVMKSVMDGKKLSDAAKDLSISTKEAKNLLKSGMERANLRNLYELIVFGLRSGIIKDEPIDIKSIEKQFEKPGFYEANPTWLHVMNQLVIGKTLQDIEREGGGSKSSIQNAIKKLSDHFGIGDSMAKLIRFSLAALNPIDGPSKIRGYKPHVSWAQKAGIGSKFPLIHTKFSPANIDPDIPVYDTMKKRDVGDEPKPKVPQIKMSYADRKKLPPPVVRSTPIQTALYLLGIDRKAITPPSISSSFWDRPSSYLWNLLELAKRRYELEIAHAHPDRGGDPRRATQLNAAWKLVQKLFARRGYELDKR